MDSSSEVCEECGSHDHSGCCAVDNEAVLSRCYWALEIVLGPFNLYVLKVHAVQGCWWRNAIVSWHPQNDEPLEKTHSKVIMKKKIIYIIYIHTINDSVILEKVLDSFLVGACPQRKTSLLARAGNYNRRKTITRSHSIGLTKEARRIMNQSRKGRSHYSTPTTINRRIFENEH